jgi:hypothetical protein
VQDLLAAHALRRLDDGGEQATLGAAAESGCNGVIWNGIALDTPEMGEDSGSNGNVAAGVDCEA